MLAQTNQETSDDLKDIRLLKVKTGTDEVVARRTISSATAITGLGTPGTAGATYSLKVNHLNLATSATFYVVAYGEGDPTEGRKTSQFLIVEKLQ